MRSRLSLPRLPLPPDLAIFSVDPNDQHDHEASFARLRGSLGFEAELSADLLTLAASGDQVLGFALTTKNRPLNAVWVQELGVDERFRGRRLASLSLQEALGSAMFSGLDLVGLSSDKDAVGYYEDLGFEHQTPKVFLTPIGTALAGLAAHVSTLSK